MVRQFGPHPFTLVGSVSLHRDGTGNIEEYSHDFPHGVRGNRYAAESFCRFDLPVATAQAGVYIITANDEVKYIGECQNLSIRFGPGQYGQISERNCHSDGQSTNCKINSLILKSVKANERIDVWFLRTSRRKQVEKDLLVSIRPPWNGRMPAGQGRARTRQRIGDVSMPTAEDFRNALNEKFRNALDGGQELIQIRSGDLHRELGGYPGLSHRMPVCCQVMRREMRDGDTVVAEPPQGMGANLVIEYRLPRQERA